MRKLLVTGGAGFIGANFVLAHLRDHPQDTLVVLDALTYAGHRATLSAAEGNPRMHFVHGDICDRDLLERLLAQWRIDTIVHFAAESHVDRSITGPAEFVRTNVVGTHELLQAARRHWVASGASMERFRFHHVSTDEVFGSLGDGDPAFTESTPYAPNSPYSASKAGSDHLVRAYHHTYGLPVTISNCSNNYGPFQLPEKLIPVIVMNAVEGRPLPIYGDGKNVRDWLYVEDHCRAIELVLQRGRVGETYNVGGHCEYTNLELVRAICAILDELLPASRHRPHEQLIAFVEDRPGHDHRYAMDCSKIERELGWRPRESLDSGLRRTIEWYLRNRDWARDCAVNAAERRGLLE